MKTCYGGYCYDHGEIKFDPPSKNTVIAIIAIAVTLVVIVAAAPILSDASLANYLSNGDMFIP